MFLQKINLINFKNYEQAELEFSPGANCISGNNGQGKTNILDAVYYLSFCKSYFNPVDSQNIMHSSPFFVIQGVFEKEGQKDSVYCGVKRNQKKQFKRNQKEYQRLADHIGLFPLVMISPTDTNLISEGSEERRKLIDSIISQYDKIYLEDLIAYNKIVAHRNALLKQFATRNYYDPDTLAIWDEQMVELAQRIFEKRSGFISSFLPLFQHFFSFIAGTDEKVNITYQSDLQDGAFAETLKNTLSKDRTMEYTTVGIHKDDLLFQLGEFPIKKYGSQGQQKSFLIAVKLAQFEMLKAIQKTKPILLLDDIFDKLDELRVGKLMELVSKESFGQIFITDTNGERVLEIFGRIKVPLNLYVVNNGQIGVENNENIVKN